MASGSLDLFLVCSVKPVLLAQTREGAPSGSWETLRCLLKDLGEEADVALAAVPGFS